MKYPTTKIWQGDTPTTQHLSGICSAAYILDSNSDNRKKRESLLGTRSKIEF